MKAQMVFKRYEFKYLITKEQKEDLKLYMREKMECDKYGKSTIRNVYFDTPTFLLIRRSLEKPVYKEKLRMRSYKTVASDDLVFVELKKKFKSVVYKRRIAMPNDAAMHWLCTGMGTKQLDQIGKEIQYAVDFYKEIGPAMFISYNREAYFGKEDTNFRITFDEEIRWRREKLSLENGIYGSLLLPDGKVLMEVKTAYAIPLWMTGWLARNKVYKTSFSKYGQAYEKMFEKNQEFFFENRKINGGNGHERDNIQRAV